MKLVSERGQIVTLGVVCLVIVAEYTGIKWLFLGFAGIVLLAGVVSKGYEH